MNKMKSTKLKEMSSPELEKELSELKSELFKLRFSLATNGLDNPLKVKEVRRDIARIKTILRERELKNQ
jgi:large subunit ribosomal protein L29